MENIEQEDSKKEKKEETQGSFLGLDDILPEAALRGVVSVVESAGEKTGEILKDTIDVVGDVAKGVGDVVSNIDIDIDLDIF